MRLSKKTIVSGVALVAAILVVSASLYLARYSGSQPKSGQGVEGPVAAQTGEAASKTVELNETQARSVKVEPVGAVISRSLSRVSLPIRMWEFSPSTPIVPEVVASQVGSSS